MVRGRRDHCTCFKEKSKPRLGALEKRLVADIAGQEEQQATAGPAHQRSRAPLLQKSDQPPEQHHEPIWVREAKIMHDGRKMLRTLFFFVTLPSYSVLPRSVSTPQVGTRFQLLEMQKNTDLDNNENGEVGVVDS